MKKFTAFIVLAALGFCGSISQLKADVLIYALTITNRVMGGGTNTVITARGKLLHDIDSGQKAIMFRYTFGGQLFYELHCADFEVKRVILPGGTNTVFASIERLHAPFDTNSIVGLRMFYARGPNDRVEIRPFRFIAAPSFLRGISREVQDAPDGRSYVIESSSLALLDRGASSTANARGDTLSEIVARQQDTWEGFGYRLVSSDCLGTL